MARYGTDLKVFIYIHTSIVALTCNRMSAELVKIILGLMFTMFKNVDALDGWVNATLEVTCVLDAPLPLATLIWT